MTREIEERIKEIERFLNIKTILDIKEIEPDLSDFCRKSDILSEGENLGSKYVAKKAYSIIQELQQEAQKYKHLWETNSQESNEIIAELKAENEKLKELTRFHAQIVEKYKQQELEIDILTNIVEHKDKELEQLNKGEDK